MDEKLHAIWELIGAIDWISSAHEPDDSSDAIRHAVELAEAIALAFPLETENPGITVARPSEDGFDTSAALKRIREEG